MSIEMYEYIKSYLKSHHLTLGEVRKCEVGHTIECYIFDSHFEEMYIWDNTNPGQPYDPLNLFKDNKHTLRYNSSFKWDIKFGWGETIEHHVHIYVGDDETNGWSWVNIDEDECVKATYEIINDGEQIPSHFKPLNKHISEYPDSTPVGWRGFIIRADDLKSTPQVHWNA